MAETNLRLLIALAVIGLFGIVTFALAAATLGTMNRRFKDLNLKLTNAPNPTTIGTSTPRPSALNSTLAEAIQINDTMTHLNRFETIAQANGNTRAVGTPGFARTVDYIEEYLNNQSYNQFNVVRENVPVQNFSIKGTPILRSTFDNITANLAYSTVLAQADFTYVNYTAEQSLQNFTLVLVGNNGCADSDYTNVTDRAVLIKLGGTCTSAEKGERAAKNNVSAILFYNQGSTTTSLTPATFRLRQANRLPALSLSYAAGEVLRKVLSNNTVVTVELEIQREAYAPFLVQNICAYTIHGNQNQTIVIGGHSDSVPAGPGINDNGRPSTGQQIDNCPYRSCRKWFGGHARLGKYVGAILQHDHLREVPVPHSILLVGRGGNRSRRRHTSCPTGTEHKHVQSLQVVKLSNQSELRYVGLAELHLRHLQWQFGETRHT